ncbi:MAG: nucleotide exchange factor GrpE [Kiloniellales bacterium]|nr:nucleotide exchange factor GrpE [Kiloniellales bacterium]
MPSNDNAKPEGEGTEDQAPAAEAAATQRDGAPETPERAAEAEPAADAAAVVAALEAEKAELKDQLLRSLAEVENVRRRAQREREDGARYAVKPLARDLLAVRDNLCRAIESVSAEAAEAEPQLKALLEGVVMTEKSLSEAFARHHVEIIDPLGEKFDPNLHEAMFEVPDPDQPAGTVAQVIEVGYRLHDRLLRAARVGVFKAAPAAPDAGAEEPPAAEAAEGQDVGGEALEGEAPGGSEGSAKPGQRIDTAV